MKYIEFTVFIARVSHEVYEKTKQKHKLGLHQKVEACLGPLLKSADLPQLFSFAGEDSSDEGLSDDESMEASGDD